MANKRYIYLFIYLFIYLAPRLNLTVSFHLEHFIVPISCPWVSEDEPREGLAACIAKTLGAIAFNQNSNRSDREKWSTSKGGPNFSKLFQLDRTDPLNFGPKFPEILVRGASRAPPVNGAPCQWSQWGGGQGGDNLPLPVPRSPVSRTFLFLCLSTPALYCIFPVIM